MNPFCWTKIQQKGFFVKFTEKEIINAVKRVLERGDSIGASAKAIGISKTVLQGYVSRAREHGYGCLIKSVGHKNYDGSFKINVVEFMREKHLSTYAAAAHFDLGRSMIQRWERKYLEEGPEALYEDLRGRKTLNQKQRGRPSKLKKQVEEDLIAENQRLRMENEFLKKLNVLVQEREERKHRK